MVVFVKLMVATLAVTMSVSQFLTFGISLQRGLQFIDWFYPHKQNHKPFVENPWIIRCHIYLNGIALLIGTTNLFYNICEQQTLISTYMCSLVLGSTVSIVFSIANQAHSISATLSFVFMALGSIVPAMVACFICESRYCREAYFLKSYAALFGAAVLFRVLALTFLPQVSRNKNEAWISMIWMSWIIPYLIVDVVSQTWKLFKIWTSHIQSLHAQLSFVVTPLERPPPTHPHLAQSGQYWKYHDQGAK